MKKTIPENFFNRSVLEVAPDLLGKCLVRKLRGREVAIIITEVEAYDGTEDKACHASRGRTPRTEVMFGPAGHFYVYLCYGMYWMLNVVTGAEGYPAAVLIRGGYIIERSFWSKEGATPRTVFLDGPGKLTRELGIDKRVNAQKAIPDTGLWIEDRGVRVPPRYIKKTPRIGISYAGDIWAKKEYRFLVDKNFLTGK